MAIIRKINPDTSQVEYLQGGKTYQSFQEAKDPVNHVSPNASQRPNALSQSQFNPEAARNNFFKTVLRSPSPAQQLPQAGSSAQQTSSTQSQAMPSQPDATVPHVAARPSALPASLSKPGVQGGNLLNELPNSPLRPPESQLLQAGPSTAKPNITQLTVVEYSHVDPAPSASGRNNPLISDDVFRLVEGVKQMREKKKMQRTDQRYTSDEQQQIRIAWKAFSDAGGRMSQFCKISTVSEPTVSKLVTKRDENSTTYPSHIQKALDSASAARKQKEADGRLQYTPLEMEAIHDAWELFSTDPKNTQRTFTKVTGIGQSTLNRVKNAKRDGEI